MSGGRSQQRPVGAAEAGGHGIQAAGIRSSQAAGALGIAAASLQCTPIATSSAILLPLQQRRAEWLVSNASSPVQL